MLETLGLHKRDSKPVNPYRVLVVHNPYDKRGGEDSVVQNEIKLLASRGHHVDYVSARRGNRATFNWGQANALAKSAWNYDEAQYVVKRAMHHRADIVHIHNFWYHISPAAHFLLAQNGFPVIQTLHNYRLLCLNAMLFRCSQPCEQCIGTCSWKGLVNKCYRESWILSSFVFRMIETAKRRKVWESSVSSFIVLTEFARKLFVKGGLPENKIDLKPNFVKSPGVGKKERLAQKASFLYVGRFSEEKGIKVLIEAFRGTDIGILMIGDGNKRIVDSVNECENFQTCGWQSAKDVRNMMKKALALIVPSIWYEGLPMVILEAYSVGLPCIASRIGGLQEIITQDKTGLLFEPGNPADLFRCARTLQKNPERAQGMGRNASKQWLQKYSPDANYKQLLSIYTKARERKLQEK